MRPFVFIMMIVPGFAFAQKARLTGNIVNGTTGKTVVIDRLSLMKPGQFGMELVKSMDNVSRFSFDDIEPVAGIPLVLRGNYQGVSYSLNVPITEAKTHTADLTVYETSTSWDKIHVRVPHMIIVRQGNHLQIEQTLEFHNNGNTTYNGDSLRLFIPETAHNTQMTTSYEDGLALPALAALNGRQYAVLLPLRPGRSRIQLSYEVDYENTSVQLRQPWSYDIEDMNIFISPRDIAVSGAGLTEVADEELARNNFAVFQKSGLKAGESLDIHLSGGSVRVRQDITDVLAEDNDIQQMIWIILPLCLALLSLTIYFGLSKGIAQRSRLIREIAALDDSYALQGIPDDQYRQKRSALKQELRENL